MGTETTKEQEKCFVIMPISDQGDYPEGHFQKVYEQIFVPAIERAGYQAFRVNEDNMSTPIIEKIFRAIQECPMAICDLSNRNPNVLYELGIRQAYDKPVVLIKDDKTERIFDVSGINTIPYKSTRLYEDVLEAREKITNAIIATKEGKHNTIVKVVKAQSAVVSSTDMSKEDRIEVLLSGLIKDVNDIKRDNINTAYIRKAADNQGSIDWARTIKHSEKTTPIQTARAVIELKEGITNKQILKTMSEFPQYIKDKIISNKDGGLLYLTIFEEDDMMVKDILSIIQDRLGK